MRIVALAIVACSLSVIGCENKDDDKTAEPAASASSQPSAGSGGSAGAAVSGGNAGVAGK
jgi:uncharacterized lipoprotein NlpE involved in copper resistance